ncbi:GAF domain-containing protein [Haloprofundus marisrubri]|uniref:GAF domain-containing protein n=1 Tax=Haloprofundus marisrubri TaxID=1514971 RepID=UPI0009E46F2D
MPVPSTECFWPRSAKFSHDYDRASTVETLSTRTDDQGLASDPFVTAIRTRELQVIEDVATDARASPWREFALRHGARSCFSIPLTYEESVYGVLVVMGRRQPSNTVIWTCSRNSAGRSPTRFTPPNAA